MTSKGLLREYSHSLALVIGAIDMLAVLMSSWSAYSLRFDTLTMPVTYFNATLIAVIITPFIFNLRKIYVSVRGERFYQHVLRLSQAVALLAFFLGGLSFFTKSGGLYSRTWFTFWMIFSLIALIAYRQVCMLILTFMRSKGFNEHKVVIFGVSNMSEQFALSVQQALWTGFKIVAFIDDNVSDKPKTIHNVPVVATPTHLGTYLDRNKIDEIWLALPLKAEDRVKEVLHELRHHTITTRLVLDIFGLDLLNHSINDLAGYPVLNIRSSPMVGVNRIIKALEDRLVALGVLIVISPLLAAISLTIKIGSGGSIILKQRRLGWDGCHINVYTFNTMNQHGVFMNSLGHFLRKTRLDELPQFLNVLQGKMSIVGPRPHAIAHNEQYKELIRTYMHRHRVKPGITGWAQINDRHSKADALDRMEKRVEYDLYYINNWSLAFDLKIIFLTLFKKLVNRNAY